MYVIKINLLLVIQPSNHSAKNKFSLEHKIYTLKKRMYYANYITLALNFAKWF